MYYKAICEIQIVDFKMVAKIFYIKSRSFAVLFIFTLKAYSLMSIEGVLKIFKIWIFCIFS